jgi:hypothetical protein
MAPQEEQERGHDQGYQNRTGFQIKKHMHGFFGARQVFCVNGASFTTHPW